MASHLTPGLDDIVGDVERTTDYMTASARSTQVGPGRIKTWGLSHMACRRIARESLINSAIHMRRMHAIRQFARRWDGQRHSPGLAIQHKDHNRPGVDTSRIDGLEERIRRAESFFFSGLTRDYRTLHQAIPALTDDHLTIDRAVVNVMWSQLGDRPVRWCPVDGASILPVTIWADLLVKGKAPPGASEGQRFDLATTLAYRQHEVDLRDVHYVQIDRSRGPTSPTAWLHESDVLLGIANPSTDMDRQGYGLSPCEASWVASSLYLFGIGYVLEFFRNSTSNMLGVLKGLDTKAAGEFINGLRTQYSGAGKHHATPWFVTENMAVDLDLKPTRSATASQMEYAATIHQAAMLCAAHYAEDPSNINLQQRGPGGGSVMSEGNRDQEISLKRSEGLINNIRFLCDCLFTPMVQLLDPDLVVVPCGIDDKAEKLEVDLRKTRVQSWLGKNEARVEEGKEAIEAPEGWDEAVDGPWWADLPEPQAAVAFQQMMGTLTQKKQQAMGLQPQGGPGGPGGPGGGGPPGGGPPGADDDQGDKRDDDQDQGDKGPPEHLRIDNDQDTGPKPPEANKAVLTVEWSA